MYIFGNVVGTGYNLTVVDSKPFLCESKSISEKSNEQRGEAAALIKRRLQQIPHRRKAEKLCR
jgi:hypothetical protein